MEEWKEYKLGEVCDTISETYKRGAQDVVLINTSDVLEGKCLNHTKVTNENLKGQFKKTFQLNDILYSEIRPANKRFAYIDFDATDYIASTKLMVLRHNDKILPQYLFYILKSQNIIDILQMLAESRSGTFPQITFSELANLDILLPNKELQNKIVSILSSLDDKIEVNRRINEQLEEMAQALFKSWFVDFEPFKDSEFVESELGMIPKGWKVGKAEDFYKITIGKTPPRKEQVWFTESIDDVKWVSISDMGNCGCFIADSSEYLTNEAIQKFNIGIVPEDTILLSFKLTIGRVAIAMCDLTTNEAIARFCLSDNALREYTYLMLKQYNYANLGSTSSIATAVNSKIIKQMRVLMPQSNVLEEFNKVLKPLFENIKKNQHEITHLTALRDTLLPKLMSGEIKV